MRKWIKRISIALGALALVLFLAIYFGGRIAVQKYLARDIVAGQGRARLVSPRFLWSLDLTADSVRYDAPSLRLAAGKTRVSVNLFRSLIHFSPSVVLETDTLGLWLSPDTAARKPMPDSIAFPSFHLPATVRIEADRITVSDSAGIMAVCEGLLLESHGADAVSLSIRKAQARQAGALSLSLKASANWDDAKNLIADAGVSVGGDDLSLHVALSKANLLKGSAELKASMASSIVYAKALKLPPSLPRAEAFTADIKASIDRSRQVTLSMKTRISGLPDTGSLRLSPQSVELKAGFKDTAGIWSLVSKGARGEDVLLKGGFFVVQGTSGAASRGRSDSLSSPAYLLGHMGVTVQGHVKGVTVAAAGKRMAADLQVAESRLSRDAVSADLTTGDGSRIQADLRHVASSAGALAEWQGAFSADLVQGERWITAFTDTNLVFTKLRVEGRTEGGIVTAMTEAYGLKAYGGMADSLRLHHRYGASGYELEPSVWYQKGAAWKLSGKVALAKRDKPMSFHLENAEFGSADFAMPRAHYMEAHVKNLAVEKLPYRGLDTLAANRPRVTADFAWDQKADSGSADVTASGRYKNESVEAHAAADWTREALEVRELKASLAGSEAKATARLKLRGKPFYALGKLEPGDYESITLKSDKFDLAKALSIAMPKPPLKSGTIAGDFGYTAARGFSGGYVFSDLQPQGEAMPASLKELSIRGDGDTLGIRAVTVSDKEPLLNDTLSLSLTGALGKIQTLVVAMRSSGGLTLGFRGDMHAYKDIEGRLGVDGGLVLPGKSGELRGLKVRAQLSMAFAKGLKGLALDADTLRGAYAVAGIDTQTFSATVRTRDGRITVPDLAMTSKAGDLKGRVDYAVSAQRLAATLTGQSLVAQFGAGDKFQLRDFRVDVQADSTQLNAQATISSASVEHVKSPMRATGDLSRIALLYRQPLQSSGKQQGKQGASFGGKLPYLRVSAVLDSSNVRYRMRSLETMQNIFKKSPQRRQASRRTKPMQLDINLETSGNGNNIETDVFRVSYVGNFSMVGTYPYALTRGRITSREGSLGLKKQAYAIKQLEVKWLNSPVEEGLLTLNAEKKLARTCEAGVTDSCSVTMNLGGTLSDMQFSYDSDCQGGYGSGVEVSALVFSVRRGCYSPGISGGGSGLTYEQQALTLLETPINSFVTEKLEKYSGKWIASAQITGLGALAQDKSKVSDSTVHADATSGAPGSTATDAVALEILSKEFWRIRLRAKSAYKPDNVGDANPWAYLAGLEWRPPIFRFIDDPVWKRRVKNNVNIDASVFTDPDRTQDASKDQVLRRVGLNYNYDFWGYWWRKPRVAGDPLRYRPKPAGDSSQSPAESKP